MTDKSSQILTAETVPAYLAEHADKLKGIFPEGATLTASAILGGNVNYAFCVNAAGSSQQVFVKQAPEFVAIFGPDGFPLTSDRMQQEMDAYAEWDTLLGEALSAKYLPKIYFFDSK
jgi:5-methylthioribose kinase